MLGHRSSHRAALGLAWWIVLAPAIGSAQGAFYIDSVEGQCVAHEGECAAADVDCGGGVCRAQLDGTFTCVPSSALLCCSADHPCFYDELGAPTVCTEVSDVRSLTGAPSTGVCLSDRAWCAGEDGVLTREELVQNLSTAAGPVRRWDDGDFDRDGVTNGEETRIGTDPCAKPAPRAYWTGERCAQLPVGCSLEETGCVVANGESGTCEVTDDDLGTECVPDGERTWCGGEFACESDQVAVVDSAERQFCVPNECEGSAEVADLVGCITDGEAIVLYSEGDCDGDGEHNASDPTPCGGPADAGATPNDAGPQDGGGDRFDGGPTEEVAPTFEGGGGCRCRAAPSGAPARDAAWIACGLALVVARRRRRR